MSEPAKTPLKLFYCYAHEDKALRDALDSHLSILKRQKLIEIWYDGKISAGMKWEHEIDKHLSSADIVLLLVSAAFLASDYCYGKEMERALQRHEEGTTRVVPIILRPVYWRNAPFSKLQVMPIGAKPITSWINPDEAYEDITRRLDEVVKELRALREAADEATQTDPNHVEAYHNKIPALPQLSVSPESPQPILDQSTELSPARDGFSLPPVPPAPPPSTQADQPVPMETPAIIPSVSTRVDAAEVSTSHAPLTTVPVSRPVQHRGVPNRRVFFTMLLVLLVVLSAIGIYYFGVVAQRTPPLSPVQATATAAAQVYAEGTARQGVMFGFDAAHTHSNPYEHILNSGNVSRLTPRWSYTTGDKIDSSPAVAGGMVYVGSDDKKLYAFDATCRNACQPLWSYTTGDIVISSPAVAGGMVYIGSYDKKLYAFDATCRNACQPQWSFATESLIQSSPAVAGGMVYVGSWDGKLYAFDATCRNACQPQWSYATGSYIASSPAVAGGMVYVGSDDKKLYAFDATCRNACQPQWSFATGYGIGSSPVVAGGMVYIGSADKKLYAFGLAG